MNNKIVTAIFLFLLLSPVMKGQEKLGEPGTTYDQLMDQIELYQGTDKVWIYLKAYLGKARKEKNWPETAQAYKEMLHECSEDKREFYADSMVGAAKMSNNNDIIGSAYLTKGIMFYQQKKHGLALDNYLLSNQYLVGTKDDYLKFKVKYHIGLIKYYLGYYHEAISLLNECVAFFKEGQPLPYLKSLHSLGLCFNGLGEIKNSSEVNRLALSECARLGISDLVPNIEHSEGINQFYLSDYNAAIRSLEDAVPEIIEQGDFGNQAVGYFYLGKSHLSLGNIQKGLGYFFKVDTIFTTKGYIRPDLREGYEILISHYKKEKQPEMQLKYIDKLLKADSVLNGQYKYLSRKIHKEYDTKELLHEKEKIHQELTRKEHHNLIFKITISILGFAVVYFVYRHITIKRLYKKRFEQLMAPVPDVKDPGTKASPLEIKPDVSDGILRKLERFEHNKGYLKKDLNAGKLAESFDTNYKYLSKVIHVQRDKNFVAYVNDLRIDYIVERLKNESKLRQYTNAALAEEAGFSTAQHFTTAFKKKTGISPGYFVENINRLDKC